MQSRQGRFVAQVDAFALHRYAGNSLQSQQNARRAVLEEDAERLVVEARHKGITLADLVAAIRRHWSRTVNKGG